MELLLLTALFLPLIGFILLACLSKVIGRKTAGLIASGTVLGSFICFSALLIANGHLTVTLYKWIAFEGLETDFSLRLDHLSLLMSLIITGVGFLIHVYSNGYMEHEEDYPRFFAFLNFFVFAMLLLVLAKNLLVLFIGWEGVGLASYLLIGFWYTRPAAAKAATKAFIVNRIGDLCLLIGIIFAYYLFGSSDIEVISSQLIQKFSPDDKLLIVLTALIFGGAAAKSAQLPLHTWLPDAMEGPTPVSALIHAATMVTAGIYLIVRLHSLFLFAPQTLFAVGLIGGVTSLYAAFSALGQTDLKRVLAYSTVSQLGLMFLSCGIGAFYAAMFHLSMHAFVKALLFLSAGNVVHMMHGATDMEKMGGLSKRMPKTQLLFLIGVLALSGIPPFSAFFSKDLILEVEHLAGFHTFFYLGLATSILTAFYLMRAYCLTFLGPHKLDEKIMKLIKEAPLVMLIPLAILAFLSIVGGFLGFSFGRMPLLPRFLYEIGLTKSEEALSMHFPLNWAALLAAGGVILSSLAAFFLYARRSFMMEKLPFNILKNAFYVDALYEKTVAAPVRGIGHWIAKFIEPWAIDGSIAFVSNGAMNASKLFQRIQNGCIRTYVALIAFGAVFLILLMIR